jgi:rhodanese-related sulfurtransferase
MLPQFAKLVEDAKKQIREITVSQLREELGRGELTLVDVRESQEVLRGKIADAIPIPRGILESQIDQAARRFDQPIVLYCASGNRSALAAESLQKMGFSNVRSLAGGWNAWTQSGG